MKGFVLLATFFLIACSGKPAPSAISNESSIKACEENIDVAIISEGGLIETSTGLAVRTETLHKAPNNIRLAQNLPLENINSVPIGNLVIACFDKNMKLVSIVETLGK